MRQIAKAGALVLAALFALERPASAANTADQVCQRWVCDRVDMSEGVSTGDLTTCDPGDLLPPGRPNALKLVNLYRFLTGMPEVTEDPTFDSDAQACAIIQAANGLSHMPTMTDTCYNAAGAAASNRSSICSGQAVGCIDGYMDDYYNASGPNYGHRTWILANSLGPVGFGSVGTGRSKTASCLYQVGGTGNAKVTYVGWPPAGPVPLQAFTATELDKSGWSLQSDTINLNSATATVTDGTTDKPVTVSTNLGSYGARYAMGMVPNGWTTQAGHSYTVAIGGTTTAISYTVQVVDCSTTSTSSCAATGTGGSPAGTGGASGAAGAGGGAPGGKGGGGHGGGGGGGATSVTGTGGSPVTSTGGNAGPGTGGSPVTSTGGNAGPGTGGSPTPGTGGAGGDQMSGAKGNSGCSCSASGDARSGLFLALIPLAFVFRRRRGVSAACGRGACAAGRGPWTERPEPRRSR
jgi:MYXO-CTERM domain-containing protein